MYWNVLCVLYSWNDCSVYYCGWSCEMGHEVKVKWYYRWVTIEINYNVYFFFIYDRPLVFKRRHLVCDSRDWDRLCCDVCYSYVLIVITMGCCYRLSMRTLRRRASSLACKLRLKPCPLQCVIHCRFCRECPRGIHASVPHQQHFDFPMHASAYILYCPFQKRDSLVAGCLAEFN